MNESSLPASMLGPWPIAQICDAVAFADNGSRTITAPSGDADLATGSAIHTSQISLHVPVAQLDSALAVLGDVVLRPTFPADELERQRTQRLTALLQRRDEPRSIASVLFNRTLFGVDHPYGIPTAGDEQSVRSFRVEDLRTFYDTYYRPNNATVIIVGDITIEAVRQRLERIFGSWSSAPIPATKWPEPRQVARRQVYLVDKPGAAQSEIRIGRIGAARQTDDYYSLVVMNTVLGGSFTSRLNQNLRETHGYTYSAGSAFDFRPLAGPFVAAAAVQSNATDSALVEFMKELRGIVNHISDEELSRARNYVALQFPESFQQVAETADQLAELAVFDLPDDYLTRYIDRIMSVGQTDVARVAKKYIDPERIVIIVVGDRARIEGGIRALKLGPITVLTVDDVLGKSPAKGP